MKRNAFWLTAVVLVLGATVAADGFTRDKARSDCPGRIVCPITGEETCQDQCPLVDARRPDCPGQIECPITGEPVCRDECLLAAGSTSESKIESEVAACCSATK